MINRSLQYTILLLAAVNAAAQTTDSVVSGRILNSETGDPLSGARIDAIQVTSNVAHSATTSNSGDFVLPLLSPGIYRIRIDAGEHYQPQEVHELELPVSSHLRLIGKLRPVEDVWEQRQRRSVFLQDQSTLVFFGPDVDNSRTGNFEANGGRKSTLESTISDVVDPRLLRELPLGGRDAYALLAVLPGVTSDTTTSRGLGLSVNGQRPSASNYLLDGLENNDYLVTGPLTAIAPEALQEYRISTNNFSAQYGRTTGFVANAVTRTGGENWHGLVYLYGKNEVLDANDFQRNAARLRRAPLKELQPGFALGGPLVKRWFVSAAFDFLRFRSRQDPLPYSVPSPEFSPPQGSPARTLLTEHPLDTGDVAGPVGVACQGSNTAPAFVSRVCLAPPDSLNRYLALPRLDYIPGGAKHYSARIAVSGLDRPDFGWTPYAGIRQPLRYDTARAGFTATTSIHSITNEARFGWNWQNLQFVPSNDGSPLLISAQDGVTLPGSPGVSSYQNRTSAGELLDNIVVARGAHILTAGGGVLLRRLNGSLRTMADGWYQFANLQAFADGKPQLLNFAASRLALPGVADPSFDRQYRYRQWFGFVQDSWRPTRRLTLNFGVRYEYPGAPVNTGATRDAIVELGTGVTFADRLKSASLVSQPSSSLYHADGNDWAARAGFALNVDSSGRTVLRGAFGIFYDRPFDNEWQVISNNSIVRATAAFGGGPVNFLAPLREVSNDFDGPPSFDRSFPRLTLYQPGIRTPYVESWFAGVQRQLTRNLMLDISVPGSAGHQLITTDIVNREFSLPPPAPPRNILRYLNPDLVRMAYRANQGQSQYRALTVTARYRGTRTYVQVSYSLSRSRDNQSDPLIGDVFNLGSSRTGFAPDSNPVEGFTRQFDSAADWGNSDFDQRHNLVSFATWQLPGPAATSLLGRLLRDWRLAEVTAIRSGLPFTVTTPGPGTSTILFNRANLKSGVPAFADQPGAGGRILLNYAAFGMPAGEALGNTRRNQFYGPGLFSSDISLARSVRLNGMGESVRLEFRADAFNFLNHANLNNPAALWSPDSAVGFGLARYGRAESAASFPILTPFAESGRQVQVLLRLFF